MRSETELAATIREAMREKNINEQELASILDVGPIMARKILCGDVVPSKHLERRMVEVLGISADKVARLSARRERQMKASMSRVATGRRAA